MFIAEIDGKEVELTSDQIKAKEDGYGVITPDNVPKGYFNEEAVQKRVQERLKNTASNVESELGQDESFHKKILSKYNIQLGEDGKPKGLKPTVDVDEVKQNITKELSSQYEERINNMQSELESRNKAVIQSSILSAVNGQYKEDWTKSFDGSEPLVVKQFQDKFTVDENGRAVVKDPENGGIKYKGNGDPMTPQDYLLDESRFGELFADKRQRSTGTNEGGKNARKFSEEEVSKKSDEDYEANREDILNSMG